MTTFAARPHSNITGERPDRSTRPSSAESARPPSARRCALEAVLALQRSAGNGAVNSMLRDRQDATGLGGYKGMLALEAGAGNRAVCRALTPRARVAREPKRSPQDEIHPEAMKFLAGKLRQLYEAIPRRDRIQLKASGTVAVGMAMVDGAPRLVYTVNNNGGSKALHAAAERLDLFRWTYDPGVQGRGSVGAPNDAEQLMTGFSKDNRAPLEGMVVSRRPCADCATVIPAYGGGRLRVVHIPDTTDLPNPRNPPSRLNPPAETVHGEIDTNKPADPPPGRRLSGPAKPADLPPGSVFARDRPVFGSGDEPIIALPKTGPVQTTATTTEPTTTTTTKAAPTATTPSSAPPAGALRAALVPTTILGANFLAGLAISWYADKIFQRNWAAAMQGVENWLRSYLPIYRPAFKPGSPLFAIVQVDIGTGDMYMGPGGGWTGTAPGVQIEEIRLADHPVMPITWLEKSPWWTRLLGFSYESKHLRFSFPLPEEPGAERVLIDAGPRQRTPIRTSRDRTPIATGGSKPRVPIRSGGGPGT